MKILKITKIISINDDLYNNKFFFVLSETVLPQLILTFIKYLMQLITTDWWKMVDFLHKWTDEVICTLLYPIIVNGR